eukprot:76018-Prymnesium_polylepis.2
MSLNVLCGQCREPVSSMHHLMEIANFRLNPPRASSVSGDLTGILSRAARAGRGRVSAVAAGALGVPYPT